MPITARIITSIEIQDGNTAIESAIGSKAFEVAKAAEGGPTPGILNLTTTDELIDLSELSTPGWLWIKNLDTTNNVNWGREKSGGSSFETVGLLYPGESCLFRVDPGAASVLMIGAVTNTAKAQVLCWEN